jgi:hypothetical protein
MVMMGSEHDGEVWWLVYRWLDAASKNVSWHALPLGFNVAMDLSEGGSD